MMISAALPDPRMRIEIEVIALRRAAAESVVSIDACHQQFERETWVEVRRLELLLDLAGGR